MINVHLIEKYSSHVYFLLVNYTVTFLLSKLDLIGTTILLSTFTISLIVDDRGPLQCAFISLFVKQEHKNRIFVCLKM